MSSSAEVNQKSQLLVSAKRGSDQLIHFEVSSMSDSKPSLNLICLDPLRKAHSPIALAASILRPIFVYTTTRRNAILTSVKSRSVQRHRLHYP